MIFEEALLKTESIKKMYSIEEVTALRKNDLKAYAEIKDNLYCPECEQPHLTHKLCSEKANHFATHVGEEHTEECSFKSEKASTNQLEALEDDKSLEKLQNRLKTAIVSLFSSEKPKHNPFVIKSESKTNSQSSSATTIATRYYAIPKKRITNGLSERDVDSLKIFYGYVKLRCKKRRNGYNLYLFNISSEKQQMICSLYLSQKVFEHININEGDCFTCFLAFYAKLETNLYNGITYFNCILTDSRKMVFVKTP